MKTIKLLLFLILGFSFTNSFGQTYLGVHSSNYGGVMSTDFQPASFVDGRFKVDIQLGGINFNTYQNAYYFDAKKARANGFKWWWKGVKPDETNSANDSNYQLGGSNPENDWLASDSNFQERYIIQNFDQDKDITLGLNNSTQVDILNFAFHVSKKTSLGLMAKIRSHTNIDNINPKLMMLAKNGLNIPSLWNLNLDESYLNVNHMTWAEIGFNYAQVVMDKKEHFIKFGMKAKWMQGLISVYMNTENLQYNLFNSDTTRFLKSDISYGYSSNLQNLANNDFSGNLFDLSTSRWGVGLDLGLVYEWRPKWRKHNYRSDDKQKMWKRSQEKYKLRFGISVLDIGGISFKKGQSTSNFSVNTTQLFDLNAFNGINNFAEFDNKIDSLILNNPDWKDLSNSKTNYFMFAPNSFGFSLDWHIGSVFYLNATGQINLISKKSDHAVRVPNQFSITPSIDYSWVGAHFPLSYNKFSGFKAGVALRLGPLTVGVTDVKTLIGIDKIYGAEVYAGLRIPIFYNEPRLKKSDKTKKPKAKTKKQKKELQNLDTDGDGVKDYQDRCPNEKGSKELNGCPDRDEDKVIDKKDNCPDIKGVEKFKGCPDTDNDGVQDSKDECPEIPGPPKHHGCPDSDGDGIFDDVDKCPEQAGVSEKQGCPYVDSDNDGVIDEKDDCPNTPGSTENNGCPF